MTNDTVGVWLSDNGVVEAPDPTNLYRYVRNNPTNLVDPNGLVGVFFDGTTVKAANRSAIWLTWFNYNVPENKKLYVEFSQLGGSELGVARFGGYGADIFLTGVFGVADTISYEAKMAARNDAAKQEFDAKVQNAFNFVMANRGKDEPVDLYGYSRGAIAAVYLAQMLKEKGVEVRFMGLIDPSTTYLSKPVPVIPDNVKLVYIAYAGGKGHADPKTGKFWSWNTAGAIASDHLIVQHDILTVEDPKKTELHWLTDPKLGHAGAGWSRWAGGWISGTAVVPELPFDPNTYLKELR